jgi:siroheme synthase-like protein
VNVYPIFLNNLSDRRCVIFGGNSEAERKAIGLLECRADVEIVSPAGTDELARLSSQGEIKWIRREYEPGDVRGAFLVIVSETNPPKTRPIFEEAERENVLINAMDDIQHCTFVAGSVVRRGLLTVAVSTSGAAPTLAVRLREEFEERFGPEYETFLDWMMALRDPMARHYADFELRRSIWYRLVDSDILSLLSAGRSSEAKALVESVVGSDVAAEAFDAVPDQA